jgi:Protein of unknown function, DUF547
MQTLRCILLGLLTLLLTPTHAAEMPSKGILKQWSYHDPNATKTIDHTAWDKFLRRYVIKQRGINRVRYVDVSTQQRNRLYDYIWLLSKKQIHEYNRKEQLVYWINLYNALVVKMILEQYPIESLKEIHATANLFQHTPMDAHRVRISHVSLSLNEIKDDIILANWKDERLLYALSSGTLGSPPLLNRAYSVKHLEQQLTEVVTHYVNSPRALKIIDQHLILSKVYQQNLKLFGFSNQNILTHLRKYANPALRYHLRNIKHIDKFVTNEHINATLPTHSDSSSPRLPTRGNSKGTEQMKVEPALG